MNKMEALWVGIIVPVSGDTAKMETAMLCFFSELISNSKFLHVYIINSDTRQLKIMFLHDISSRCSFESKPIIKKFDTT